MSVREGHDADWDQLCVIAGSELVAVAEGRSHWGRPLLSGLLRAASRVWHPQSPGVAARLPPIFLYHALSYDQATERWTERWLSDRGK